MIKQNFEHKNVLYIFCEVKVNDHDSHITTYTTKDYCMKLSKDEGVPKP